MTDLEIYIEEVGLFYERFGLPKMAGRILGFLMATPEEKISFEDMASQLQASKGSISGNVNLLLGQKLIEKFTVSGDRKTYYRFSGRNIARMLEDKLHAVHEIAHIFGKANTINANTNSEKHRQIHEIVDFYKFLEEEIPKLKTKWIQQRSRQDER